MRRRGRRTSRGLARRRTPDSGGEGERQAGRQSEPRNGCAEGDRRHAFTLRTRRHRRESLSLPPSVGHRSHHPCPVPPWAASLVQFHESHHESRHRSRDSSPMARSRTHLGRPQWRRILPRTGSSAWGTPIGDPFGRRRAPLDRVPQVAVMSRLRSCYGPSRRPWAGVTAAESTCSLAAQDASSRRRSAEADPGSAA